MKYIYALIDPRNRQIRYIGQTDDISKRLLQHIADKANTPKGEWIRGLTAAGVQPEIIQLAQVGEGENAHEIEYRWVYFGRNSGWELTNTIGMKSEDYYHLQGFFEHLMVDMEKPEDVISRQYTMEDARKEFVNLFVRIVKSISDLPHVIRSRNAAIAFCIASLLICIGTTDSHSESSLLPFGVIVSLVSTIGTVLFLFGWILSTENEVPEDIFRVFRVIGFIDLCLTLVIIFFG